jgi:hypothetical protein
LPIVDGLEGSGTAGYADLPVVHSERKFQSHPAIPPGRLIGFHDNAQYCMQYAKYAK